MVTEGTDLATSLTRAHPARARRLGAALVECVIDRWGHAGLRERLLRPAFCARLAGLLGVAPGALERTLQRGLARDMERLALDAAELRPRCVIAPPGAVALFGRGPAAPDHRLAAAAQVAFGPMPAPFAKLARVPLVGTRAVFAAALFAELVALPIGAFDDDTTAVLRAHFAFGAASAEPYAFCPQIADAVLGAVEAQLHHGPAARSPSARTDALCALFSAVVELEPRVVPASDRGLVRRHQRLLPALGPVQAMARRPARHARRSRDYVPPPAPAAGPIEDAQGDLFAW